MASDTLYFAPFAAALGVLGPAIGIGMIASSFFSSVARQPETFGKLSGIFYVAAGMVEALGFIGFAAFFLALGK